ncbi:MAG TPA: DNRLRE domain-containing protein [Actinoplanes sp.]|nr:DNRLRE domain-containing protein [Actinoplanes sp.]
MRRSNLRKPVTVLTALLAGTGSALVAPIAADAATGPDLKLAAVDDSYTSSGRRGTTFGREDKLAVGRLAGDSKVSFLKFVVPAGTDVAGSRLKLTTVGAVSGKITVSRVVDNSWTEGKLTAGNAPALGLPLASATGKAGSAELSFDLGGEIAGPGAYSFAVRSSSGTEVTRIRAAEGKWGGPELTVRTAAAAAPVPVPVETTPAEASTPTDTDIPPPAPAGTTTPPAPVETSPPTTAPTTAPSTPPASPASGDCVTGALLVPSCGVLWGAAAGGFTSAPRDQELKDWEKRSGRTATIFHTYHKGDELFPTKAEIAMARDAAHPRVLLLNWKIEYGSTWAKVANGDLDKRIDAFAARVKSTFPEKFFLVLNHEPEDDVVPTAGSGMTAKDFAASYRHTILRLRAKGLGNIVNVVAYMGNEKWMSQSWWKDLYPGDDVVDWMGLDSYVSAEKNYYHAGMFADLLDRKGTSGPAFYDWAVSKHPSKPMMVAEWGAYHRVGHVVDKAAQFNSVLPELAKRPQIKAIVYFDTAHDNTGDRDISINSMPSSLTAFKKLAANPIFDVRIG